MAQSRSLSILVITKAEEYTPPFLEDLSAFAQAISAECVVACDGREPLARAQAMHLSGAPVFVTVKSHGFLESVLDLALCACRGEYVLRIDDDEKISPAMKRFLIDRVYEQAKHWKFPRVHFWGDTGSVLLTPHLYPDWQTRLSIKAWAGHRPLIHSGSIYGGGEDAMVQIEHHKFLVKSYDERLRIAQVYDSIMSGAGTGGMVPFSLPERAYRGESVVLGSYGAGDALWKPVTRRVRF